LGFGRERERRNAWEDCCFFFPRLARLGEEEDP